MNTYSSTSPFDPAECWPVATAAVNSIVKHYPGFFTKEDVEDLAIVVASKMWAAKDSFDPEKGKLFSWTWKIARNVILDAVDEKIHKSAVSGDIERVSGNVYRLPFAGNADDELICNDTVETFVASLKNARDRRILFYLLQGLNNAEIAKREGITPSAAAMAVFYLRQKLRKRKGSA